MEYDLFTIYVPYLYVSLFVHQLQLSALYLLKKRSPLKSLFLSFCKSSLLVRSIQKTNIIIEFIHIIYNIYNIVFSVAEQLTNVKLNW